MATSSQRFRHPARSYPVTGTRRRHDRVDLSQHPVEAWLVLDRQEPRPAQRYTGCQLLNLSYAGMCLQGEDLFEAHRHYRFILDLSSVLGTEVEVTARVVWRKPMGGGLCYLGAEFVKSSAPWLGPEEEDEPPSVLARPA